jgi:hypothetical protein
MLIGRLGAEENLSLEGLHWLKFRIDRNGSYLDDWMPLRVQSGGFQVEEDKSLVHGRLWQNMDASQTSCINLKVPIILPM